MPNKWSLNIRDVVWLLLIFSGIIGTWATTNFKVSAQDKAITSLSSQHVMDAKEFDAQQHNTDIAITEIRGELKQINSTVGDIKDQQHMLQNDFQVVQQNMQVQQMTLNKILDKVSN